MNVTVDSSNKFYHDKPQIEFKKFENICSTNLDGIEEILQSINIEENIWEDVITYKAVSDKIAEEFKIYCVDTALTDGEIEYYKRKICTQNEDIAGISQLIQECVVTLNELEHEKNEMMQNISNKHKAIKQAIKYFKKRLNIYISVDKQTNFAKICLFTQKEDDLFSFNISINEDDNIMKLENTNPKMNETQFIQLQTNFKEDQNLCALLCSIRKIFLELK